MTLSSLNYPTMRRHLCVSGLLFISLIPLGFAQNLQPLVEPVSSRITALSAANQLPAEFFKNQHPLIAFAADVQPKSEIETQFLGVKSRSFSVKTDTSVIVQPPLAKKSKSLRSAAKTTKAEVTTIADGMPKQTLQPRRRPRQGKPGGRRRNGS